MLVLVLSQGPKNVRHRGHACVRASQPRQRGDVAWFLPKRVASGSGRAALPVAVSPGHFLEPVPPVSVGLGLCGWLTQQCGDRPSCAASRVDRGTAGTWL